MYISCCLCQFCLRWLANAKANSGGIWALLSVSQANMAPASMINREKTELNSWIVIAWIMI